MPMRRVLKTIILIAKKDFASAYATVEQALRKKPDDLALLQLKLQIHTQSNDMAAVEQDYLDLIKQFPDSLQYSYALAKHYADNGHEDKAVAMLQSVIDKHPNDLQPKLVLVDYFMQKAPEMAEKHINTFLGQFPEAADLHFRLAGLYIKQNKIAEAKQILTKVVELKPDSKDGQKSKMMLARIAFQENDFDTAKNQLKEVLGKDKHNLDAHLLKARLDIRNGLNDEVISDLRGVLRDFPNSDEAFVLLGQAYVKKNSPELAEENFRKALALNPSNFDALLPVVAAMMKNQDAARAEELLQKALKTDPNHAGALQTLAQVKIHQKDWNGAQKIADVFAADSKSKGFGKFLSGKIAEQRGLCKEAIGLYKESLSLSPDSADALRGMASCYASLEQENAMVPYLSEFIAAHPDNGYAVLLKSQLLAGAKKYEDALALLENSIGKWPKATELYEAMAMIHMENKDHEKAIAILNKGLENQADAAKINLVLASLYEQTGDYAKALAVYNDLIAKYPDDDVAVNNVVSLLLDHFNSKENVERAASLAKRFEKSNQPYFLDSYGWALLHSGRHEEALQIFKNVVSKLPDTAVFRYHLGAAYQKTGNKTEAARELQKALDLGSKSTSFPDKDEAEKLLSSIK